MSGHMYNYSAAQLQMNNPIIAGHQISYLLVEFNPSSLLNAYTPQ
jgi:hypothetical protein